MGLLCYVEGIPSAGKTTVVKQLARYTGFRKFLEPVDVAHLNRFYANPKAFAFHMQIYFLHKRIGLQMLAACEALYSPDYRGSLVDRSLFGDAVFAELHHEEGNITDLDWGAYRAAHLNMKLMIWPPTVLLYLKVDPEVAYERLRNRLIEEHGGRDFEMGVTVAYLQKLAAKYQGLIEAANSGRWPWGHAVQVWSIDWNQPVTSETYEDLAERLLEAARNLDSDV